MSLHSPEKVQNFTMADEVTDFGADAKSLDLGRAFISWTLQ
jgi:hypothetical protein